MALLIVGLIVLVPYSVPRKEGCPRADFACLVLPPGGYEICPLPFAEDLGTAKSHLEVRGKAKLTEASGEDNGKWSCSSGTIRTGLSSSLSIASSERLLKGAQHGERGKASLADLAGSESEHWGK